MVGLCACFFPTTVGLVVKELCFLIQLSLDSHNVLHGAYDFVRYSSTLISNLEGGFAYFMQITVFCYVNRYLSVGKDIAEGTPSGN